MKDRQDCTVVPYCAEHVENVWAIDRLCFADPWIKRTFIEELDACCALNRVAADACDCSRIIGFSLGRLIADEYTIHRLAVHPDWQRCGIASRMLHTCLQHACRHGALHCFIEVRSGNTAAQNLYHMWGFERIGQRKEYYRVGSEDAILMSCRLDTTHCSRPL